MRRWLLSLAWMGLIFFFSAQSALPSVPSWWDLVLKKGGHILAYAVLTWLYLRALRGDGRSGSWDNQALLRAVSAGMALLYALSDEYHQTFVPGRQGSLVDVAVDGVGVSVVILLDWWLRSEGASQ